MHHTRRSFFHRTFLAALACCITLTARGEEKPPIRVALGGKTTADIWRELAAKFETDTGWKTQLVASGSKDAIADAFKRGEVDLIIVHGSDQTDALVADGIGVNLRPWARNELTIVGPAGDPAGIRGMKDGAEALKKIAATRAPLVDAAASGTGEILKKLWQRAGLKPEGDWVLRSESESPGEILAVAGKKQAYAFVGRISAAKEKTPLGKLEVLVQGDPEMRRTYIAIEANPKKFPQANATGARALADWLVGEKGQTSIREYGRKTPGGIPLYDPVNLADEFGK
jgi:tungstate transport system substrate-binding protein